VPDSDLIASLRAAVEAAPGDVTLRLHLAELLLAAGEREDALRELGRVLALEPGSEQALELIGTAQAPSESSATSSLADRPAVQEGPSSAESEDGVDWEHLERDFEGTVEPMFVEGAGPLPDVPAWDVEREQITLADVGGLAEVKERLELAFLAPLRNPELRRLYGKDLRGGLLLYGPPGCGKGFVARALAGELGAAFISVSINEVLDMWIGNSEQNLHEIFVVARRNAPSVVFFDEIDALGRRRSQLSNNAMRTTVNQLLSELDGIDSAAENQNVFTLAATNQPWDIDPALRRPGRFDRTLLVLPPDEEAREAIFRTHLKDRPVAGIDLRKLARSCDGYSGADIRHVCDTAAEKALADSVRTGEVRMIEMGDLDAALKEVKPSVQPWFEMARNVVSFANKDGAYDDLLAYMKKRRML
jgi:SpoVK/Ycf46/Vps4 family AAA+-type ATPase